MRLMKLSQLLDYIKDRAGFEEILRGLDVPAFAINSPIAIDHVREREEGISLDEAQFLLAHTDRQTKMPIPGPYLLTRSSWFEGLSDKTYPSREDLAKDVVRILRREVIALKEAGGGFFPLDQAALSPGVHS